MYASNCFKVWSALIASWEDDETEKGSSSFEIPIWMFYVYNKLDHEDLFAIIFAVTSTRIVKKSYQAS